MRIEKNVVYRNKKHRRASGRFVVFLVYFVRSFSTHALHMDRTYESSKCRHISAEATLSSPWNIYAYTFRFALEYSLAFYKIYRTCFIFRRLFVTRMARRVDDSNFYAYTFATGVGGIHAGMVEWPTMHPYANCAMCIVHESTISEFHFVSDFSVVRSFSIFFIFLLVCISSSVHFLYEKQFFQRKIFTSRLCCCRSVAGAETHRLFLFFVFDFMHSAEYYQTQ